MVLKILKILIFHDKYLNILKTYLFLATSDAKNWIEKARRFARSKAY